MIPQTTYGSGSYGTSNNSYRNHGGNSYSTRLQQPQWQQLRQQQQQQQERHEEGQ
jgi:hypothetical protein